MAEFDNKKWREIQTIEKYENNLNIINGGKIQILDKTCGGKIRLFLHWTKNSKIVEKRKLFEKIQNSGI